MNSNHLQDQLLKYSAFAILLAGIGLRINQFTANRSLWLDEAMLALNIVDRSFWDLFGELDYWQAAPPVFLFVQKLIVTFIGSEDFALRIFPMIASLGALYLMYRVSARYVGGPVGLVALGLFSFSDKLVYYASENKQYSTDVLCTLALLFSAGRCLEDDAGSSDYLLLGLLGVVSIFLSHPAVFVLSGVSAGFLWKGFVTKDRKKWVWLGRVFLAWFVCCVILYFASLRTIASNAKRLGYFQSAFMPWPPWEDPSWFGHIFLRAMNHTDGLAHPVFLILALFFLILVAAGAVSFFYRKRPLAFVIIVPFVAVLAASGFHKYPVTVRHALFLIPLMYLLIAEAVEVTRLALGKFNPLVSWTCCILMIISIFFHPVSQGISGIWKPEMREHIKPVLARVQENKSEGDGIYVYYAAWPAFSFYAKKYGFREGDVVRGIESREEPEKYLQDIERFTGNPRVWLIVSHNCSWCRVNEEKFIIDSLLKKGTLMKEFKAPGAVAYLFNLSGK